MKIVVDAMGGDHAPAVVVEGAVMSVNTTAGTMVVTDSNSVSYDVRVPAGATILDLRSGCESVNFSTIKEGDKVVFFGLSTYVYGMDFEAPVVLIVG